MEKLRLRKVEAGKVAETGAVATNVHMQLFGVVSIKSRHGRIRE